jgi:hypothetical protein
MEINEKERKFYRLRSNHSLKLTENTARDFAARVEFT